MGPFTAALRRLRAQERGEEDTTRESATPDPCQHAARDPDTLGLSFLVAAVASCPPQGTPMLPPSEDVPLLP